MDRFSEQLLKKIPSGKDMFLRGVIIAGEMVLIILLVIATLLFQFSIIPLTFALLAGSVFLVKYLFEATMIEYEYIVTNDDLDIDKIIGRRKRKRLITISLQTVLCLEPYDENKVSKNAEVVVLAHDNSGENLWHLIADDSRYGSVAVVFNPDTRTVENMAGGFEPKLKAAFMAENGIHEAEEASGKETDKDTEI